MKPQAGHLDIKWADTWSNKTYVTISFYTQLSSESAIINNAPIITEFILYVRNGASAARRDGEPNRGAGLQVDEETDVILKVTGGHLWICVLVFHSLITFYASQFSLRFPNNNNKKRRIQAQTQDIFTALT